MSDGNKNTLEKWVIEQLKPIEPNCHRVPGSGCGDIQKLDISSKYIFCECKIRRTQENIIIQYKHLWLKLLDQIPSNSNKIPIICIENQFGEKFVTLKATDFFDLLKEAKA
jgi:hypothetical protein